MTVSRITIHHEGAGNPVDWARGGGGGYSIWLGDVNGDHVYDVLRPPDISFATLNFNHVSLDICLSGDRDVYPVTDADIWTLSTAVKDARDRGWVTAQPYVVPHHLSPGSNTVCPGTHAYPERWNTIVAACTGTVTTPAPSPFPTPAPHVQPNVRPVLTTASSGQSVKEAQLLLDFVANQHLTVDGSYGPATVQAVKNFQTVLGLTVDGVCGAITWGSLLWCAAVKSHI